MVLLEAILAGILVCVERRYSIESVGLGCEILGVECDVAQYGASATNRKFFARIFSSNILHKNPMACRVDTALLPGMTCCDAARSFLGPSDDHVVQEHGQPAPIEQQRYPSPLPTPCQGQDRDTDPGNDPAEDRRHGRRLPFVDDGGPEDHGVERDEYASDHQQSDRKDHLRPFHKDKEPGDRRQQLEPVPYAELFIVCHLPAGEQEPERACLFLAIASLAVI